MNFNAESITNMLNTTIQHFRSQSKVISAEVLRSQQRIPWASLADGIGGQAYTLWYINRGQVDREELDLAASWLFYIRSNQRKRSAFHWADGPRYQGIDNTLIGSIDGIRYTQILISLSLNKREQLNRELSLFLSYCRLKRSGNTEWASGLAGYLTAVCHLYVLTKESRLYSVAKLLAEDLLNRIDEWAETRKPSASFAHGWVGILHSLLTWSHVTQCQLPEVFYATLHRCAQAVAHNQSIFVPTYLPSILRRAWCTGAAGWVLLWVRAYELTGEEVYRSLAKSASSSTYDHPPEEPKPGTLCCGLTGRAYALLAMDRIAVDQGWHTKATRLASMALESVPDDSAYWTSGLFRGHCGLVCLASDLLANDSERRGFPIIECLDP